MIRLLGAFVAGAILPLAFSPFDWAPVAIISLLALLLIWRDASAKQAMRLGYVFGLGYFGFGVYWVYFSIHHFAYAPLLLAVIIMLGLVAILACYPALLGYVLNRWAAKSGMVRYCLAFPLFWVAIEALRSWLFTGFPWLLIGYSQIDTWLSGWAPISGVLGLSWGVAFTAGSVMCLVASSSCHRYAGLIVSAIIWGGGWMLTTISWTQPAGPALQVALVQANIPQEIKWLSQFRAGTMRTYTEMTRPHWDADVVVWPETAIPAFHHHIRQTFLADLSAEVRAQNSDLIAGLPVKSQTSPNYYNGLISLAEPDRFYLKQHLVPLGEYMPLKPLSTMILAMMQIPLSDFSAGEPGQSLLTAGGYSFASSICYEDVFEHASLDGLPEAAYLVNVSNDTWFGDTIAPAQHLQMARMRSLESGRYMLRATSTGITAIMDHKGKVVEQAPMFQRFVLRGELIPMQGATPYVAGWSKLRWVLVILLMGVMLRFRKAEISRYKT